MTTLEAVQYFGSKRKLAEALKLSTQAIQAWGDTVPPLREYQLKDIMATIEKPLKLDV